MQFRGLTVAVPREILPGERRAAAIPQTVRNFVDGGAKVIIESEAGAGAFFADEEYRAAGAEVLPDAADIYARANILLKVKEPQYNESLQKHEAELLPDESILVCFLHPAHPVNHEAVEILRRKGVTGFTLDGIPRISSAQQMDPLTTMSTAAGYKAVLIAASHLPRFVPMMPTAFGMIQPAQFVIVGAGVAGLQAIATAKRLGAKVKVLDIRPEAREQAQSLGAELIPFDIPAELAVGEGGYARRLPDEWYAREREALSPHLQACDAAIFTALVPGEKAPVLADEAMVEGMKKGSVIVDISIDQGGNCLLTRYGEEYDYRGTIISGLVNIPARLAVDSTWMFAQNAWHFLKHIVEAGAVKTDRSDPVIRGALVTCGGSILHQGTLSAMGLNGDG